MKQTLLAVIPVLLLISGNIGAQTRYEFSVSPVAGMSFGDTRFDLGFTQVLDDTMVVSGGSELVFPLDVKQAGVEVGFRYLKDTHALWTVNLRLMLHVSDPGSKMTDRDWITLYNYTMDFSSTESTVDGSLTELEFEATRLLVSGRSVELAVLVGLGYQKVKHRMVDLSGWQYVMDADSNLVPYTFYVDDLVGTYEVRYLRPQLGVAPRFLFGSLAAELKMVVSPLLHVKDIDDHVLRYFQIRTDGKGFGYGGRLALVYDVRGRGRTGPFVALSGDWSRAKVDVSGYREYYADNPDEGASRGDQFAEEHEVSSTQYGVRFQFGVRF